MSSISEVYGSQPVGKAWTKKQLVFGVFLFTLGALLLIGGIIAATTDIFINQFDLLVWESWKIAGISAGVGLPCLIVGVFIVLPSTTYQKMGATLGLSLSFIGVGMFVRFFPFYWVSQSPDYTLETIGVYFVGIFITLGYMFYSIAMFKTRNAPGGTVSLNINIGSSGEEKEKHKQNNKKSTRKQKREHRGVLREADNDALKHKTQTAKKE